MKRFRIFILFFSLLIGSDSRPFTIPTIELNKRTDLQTIVDQEDGIYLGHPSTVLLEDGNTILIVYPKGHGKGEIIYKRSEDCLLYPSPSQRDRTRTRMTSSD